MQGTTKSVKSVLIVIPAIDENAAGSATGVILFIAVFGAVISYMMQMVAFVVLRRRFPDVKRPYRSPTGVWGAVVAFILAFVVCFLLVMSGFPMVLDWFRDWAWPWITEGIAALSFYTHFENITKGVLDLRDVLYFALVIVFFLVASAVALDSRKSQ